VLFDAVGTLLRPVPCVADVYAAAGRRHGIDLSAAEVGKRFALAFARQEQIDQRWLDGRTSEPRELQRWRRIVRRVFGRTPAQDRIFAELWDHFGQPGSWQLDPAVGAVWTRLASAGYVLGIASNFDSRLLGICRAMPELAACPYIFVSSQIGWKKPNSGFFRAIEDKLALDAGQIMLVGDDVDNDYLAARAAGWQAVLLDPAGEHPELDAIAGLGQLADRLVSRHIHVP
jgi:putative hydrolase of the HAD superfamily